jgi:hypothetical protein
VGLSRRLCRRFLPTYFREVYSGERQGPSNKGKPIGGPNVKQFTRTEGAEIRERTVMKCDPGWYVVRLAFGVE